MVNEVRYANEDNWHYGTPLGVWGGECTCPDGRVYTAGDQGNLCGSINCFGGTEGRCTQAQGRWAFREVHCARFPQPIGRGDTVLENQYSTAGIFGGTCTCPNGNVYLVGDRNDQCKSLSCEGGVSGVCNHYASTWSHRKVICAPSETSPPPEAPGCLDWCETDFVTPIETKCVSSRCKNCTFCPKPPPLPPPPPAFPAASPRPPPPSPSPPPPPSPLQPPLPSPPPPPPALQSPPPGLQSPPPPPSPPSPPPGKLLQRLETRAAKEAEKKAENGGRTGSKAVQQSAELSLTQRPTSTERLARILPAGVTPAQAVASVAAAFLALLATLLCCCCCCARWRRSGASRVERKGTPKLTRDGRKGRRQRLPVDEEVGADEIRHSKVRDTKRSPRNKGKPSLVQPDTDPYVI